MLGENKVDKKWPKTLLFLFPLDQNSVLLKYNILYLNRK